MSFHFWNKIGKYLHNKITLFVYFFHSSAITVKSNDIILIEIHSTRLAPKVKFFTKSQVKSPKSQVMTLTFFKIPRKSKSWLWLFLKSQESQSHDFDFFQNPKKVKVMTLTFFKFQKKSKSWLWLFLKGLLKTHLEAFFKFQKAI